MEVYRISKADYINSIDGMGAYLFGGRWNPKGMRMLYTSQNRSLAALEFRAHLADKIPPNCKIATIHVPDDSIETVDISRLPDNWGEIPPPAALASFDKEWLVSGSSLGLKVPSVLIKKEFNILINPLHSKFNLVKIKSIDDFPWDKRLF